MSKQVKQKPTVANHQDIIAAAMIANLVGAGITKRQARNLTAEQRDDLVGDVLRRFTGAKAPVTWGADEEACWDSAIKDLA